MGAVKLCGVYTTALAELLSKNGIKVSTDNSIEAGSTDTLIYDKEDRNGVTVHGNLSEKIIDVLKKKLPDVIHHKVETGTIHCGLVKEIDRKRNSVTIDIGHKKMGELPIQSYWGLFKEGEKVMVQIKGETRGEMLLSTQLRLFGDNLILIKKGFTKVSKHIRSSEEKKRLLDLSDQFKIEGWGILWKALAENKSDEDLKKEIEVLLKKEESIRKKFDSSKGGEKLEDGLCIHFLDFGKGSKEILDELRSKVRPTIKGHHILKSMGFAFAAELGDSLAGKKSDIEKVVAGMFKPNQYYRILLNKLNGRTICIKGKISDVGDSIVVKRGIKPVGDYLILGIKKEKGDYSITSVKSGEMFVKETYFNSDGKEKGTVFSVSLPFELSPAFARSVGLGLQVVEKEGKKEIVNQGMLEDAVEQGRVSKDLKDKAVKIANEIVGGKIG
jgi:hypothetical protein